MQSGCYYELIFVSSQTQNKNKMEFVRCSFRLKALQFHFSNEIDFFFISRIINWIWIGYVSYAPTLLPNASEKWHSLKASGEGDEKEL